MICSHCGHENQTAFGYCAACGKGLNKVEGLTPPPAPAAPKTMSIFAMLGVAAVVLLAIVFAFTRPVDSPSAAEAGGFRIGTILGALLIPGGIAYAIAGRKKARNPNLFAVIFCLVGAFIIGANWLSTRSMDFEPPEQRFSRLMREAAGLQPVRQAMSSHQRQWDDAIRDQYRNIVQLNREYVAKVKQMDSSKVKNINTAESFADPNSATEGLNQLHALFDVDFSQEAKMEEVIGNLRQAIASGARSAQERETMLNAMDSKLAEQMAQRGRVLTAEKAWNDSVDKEYAYAGEHAGVFQVRNGHLIIANETVRQEFNSRLNAQQDRRVEFMKLQEEFSRSQAQMLQKMGMSTKDVGQ